MPLDLDSLPPNTSFETILPQLRKAVIGNSALKARLTRAPDFLWWLQSQMCSALENLDRGWPEFASRIEFLHLLVTPESSVTPGADHAQLMWCVPLIGRFLDHVSGKALAEAFVDPSESSWTLLDSMVTSAFSILLELANVSPLAVAESAEPFWRSITSVALVTHSPSSDTFPLKKALQAGLALVPVYLESDPGANADALLAVVLRRLLTEFNHFPKGEELKSTEKNAELTSSTFSNLNDMLMPNTVPDFYTLEKVVHIPILCSLIVVAAQLLNYFKPRQRSLSLLERQFYNSTEVRLCLVALLQSNGVHLLSTATLNLISCYLDHISSASHSQEKLATSIIESLFPRIIDLLGISNKMVVLPKFLELPISILSDLCLKYPGVCSYIRNTNVDFQIMSELESLFSQSLLLKQIHILKTSSGCGTKLVDFNGLKSSIVESRLSDDGVQTAQIDTIANYLLLLSVFTSSNDEFRRRVASFKDNKQDKNTTNFLSLMVFELVDNFRFLCEQMLLSYKAFSAFQKLPREKSEPDFLPWFGGHVGMLMSLIDHPIYSNTFYLIRSLSRSVSTLRTFFIDCNSIQSPFDNESSHKTTDSSNLSRSILEIVSSNYDKEMTFDREGSFVSSLLRILNVLDPVYTAMMYFSTQKSKERTIKRHFGEISNAKFVILLALLANFILDFTSFRYEIVNNDTFLKDLSNLYKKATETKREYDYSEIKDLELRDTAYESSKIQLGVLQIIKNYLYNENEENRKYMWEFIPLSIVFEKSLYGILIPACEDNELHKMLLQHKVIAFEIMRNLTASSTYFSEIIKDLYTEFVQEQEKEGLHHLPSDWNDYLVSSILSFDLFVDVSTIDKLETKFLSDDEFLLRLLLDPDYVRLIVGINYTEDHRYTNSTTLRKRDLPSNNLLNVWKRLLEVELSKDLERKICHGSSDKTLQLFSQLSEVKVSIDWLLINLTWKDQDFGYPLTDKVNFRLLDTVRANSDSGNMFSATNIVVEDNEDEEEEEEGDEKQSRESGFDLDSMHENTVVSPEDRAQLLYKHGFANTLQRLIRGMCTPVFDNDQTRHETMKRFQNLNANDLYEKSKTAHHQIIQLVAGVHDNPRQVRFRERKEEKHPLRRQSNIINARDGFRARQEIQQAAEMLMIEPESEGDQNETDESNHTEPEADMDDYWIR
ncbi:hypothetical protein E0198_000580 [Clavispora lusitaniae]|nr:hypothetical protein E0198_000580 [Clavispora lusitaniae]